jgi:protein O-GlcNAc transferase
VLQALPSARLLLFHHTLTAAAQERIRGHFARRGIAGQRLDLRQGSCDPGYLAVLGEIDVCLDPFPCSGGVTSCEALWMGVPVISLCGQRPMGRNSAAILARVGLADWAVPTAAQYVARAVDLAKDLKGLSALRAELRGRMTATLCDAERFTRGLENAFRGMWRRWCGGDTSRGA